MKYNFQSVGERIRKLRKSNPETKSQEAFISILKDKYGFAISRNKLSAIENGEEKAFSLEFLLRVCDLFNCDIGYLLGEYEESTIEISKICEYTGLNENSIKWLHTLKEDRSESSNYYISFIDLLLYNNRDKNGFSPFFHIFNTIADFERLKILLVEALESQDGIRGAALSSVERDYNLFLFTLSHKLGDVFESQMDKIIECYDKEDSKNGNNNPENK